MRVQHQRASSLEPALLQYLSGALAGFAPQESEQLTPAQSDTLGELADVEALFKALVA